MQSRSALLSKLVLDMKQKIKVQRERSNLIEFHAIAWYAPIFVNKNSKLSLLKDWYGLDLNKNQSHDFTWGYRGTGPYATAYSILREAFGKKAAEEKAQEFMENCIEHIPKLMPFKMSGDTICKIVNMKKKY